MSRSRGICPPRLLALLLAVLGGQGPQSVAQEAKPGAAVDPIAALDARAKANPADAAAATRLGSALLERARRTRDFRAFARAEAAFQDALARDAKHVPAMVL